MRDEVFHALVERCEFFGPVLVLPVNSLARPSRKPDDRLINGVVELLNPPAVTQERI